MTIFQASILNLVGCSPLYLPLLLVILGWSLYKPTSWRAGYYLVALPLGSTFFCLMWSFLAAILYAWIHNEVFRLPDPSGQTGMWNMLLFIYAGPLTAVFSLVGGLVLFRKRKAGGLPDSE